MKKHTDEQGQAAVEAIYSVLVVLLLMLGAAQLLYASLVSNEAVQKVHKEFLTYFREKNASKEFTAEAKEIQAKVEVEAGAAYGAVVNNWTLFHREYSPKSKPTSRYSGGEPYVAERGVFIGAGPLKGTKASAVGYVIPGKADGLGLNKSGGAKRTDAFDNFCDDLGMKNTYFRD